MITTLNKFLKIFLYLLLIYFSLFYFYLGFQKLKDSEYVINNENDMEQNNEILNNKKILDSSIINNVEIPKFFPEEEIKEKNEIIEEKITLRVKKNDTLIQLFKPINIDSEIRKCPILNSEISLIFATFVVDE